MCNRLLNSGILEGLPCSAFCPRESGRLLHAYLARRVVSSDTHSRRHSCTARCEVVPPWLAEMEVL